jgi:hypothetical protein
MNRRLIFALVAFVAGVIGMVITLRWFGWKMFVAISILQFAQNLNNALMYEKQKKRIL